MKPINKAQVEELQTLLQRLEKELEDAEKALVPLRENIYGMRQKLAEALAVFEVGERVLWKDGRNEKKAAIEKICYSYGRPEYYVKVFRKDGTLGTRVSRVWCWTGKIEDKLRLDTERVVSNVGGASL